MSKAIAGAALLVGAAAALTVLTGGLSLGGILALSTTSLHVLGAVALAGVSMEAGAISDALSSNRGSNITTRQPASYRQIVYGEQRIGGVLVYASTTGGTHRQYNQVIALVDDVIDSIVNLYLDGRQVAWTGSGNGNSTRNGVNFGGNAAGGDRTGPNGATYNFGGLVYCEPCFGDQTNQPNTSPNGGYNTGLHANDPSWAPSANGLPYLGGIAYVYLKVEYDANQFPQRPETRFTVRGRNQIMDPRTGTRGYTNNWALIVADWLQDHPDGLGDAGSVNVAQLIAAANVCDEQVPLAAGGTESRYTMNCHFDTSLDPGSALDSMMAVAGGRLSRIGGEWFIWPAYWQGPTLAFNEGHLAEAFTWNPTRSFKDLVNRVSGTYTAPNYPYNATRSNGSNLYDTNGFAPDGSREDTFNLAWQPTSFPEYAADPAHGYPADQYLNDDGGIPLPKELNLQWCTSVSQAQRVAKIALERNRQQGTGSMTFFPVGMALQPLSVMHFSFKSFGWTDKTLEVGKTGVDPMTFKTTVEVNETSPSVYSWSPVEELTIYAAPAGSRQPNYVPGVPRNVLLTSSAATALQGRDGVVQPRVLTTWDDPLDGFVTQIEGQVQGPLAAGVTAPTWQPAFLASVQNTSAYISGLVAGSVYNVRIRSLRANGGKSPWVEIDGFTVSITLSTLGESVALEPGILIAEAYANGTASIIVPSFTASVGGLSIPVLPAGPYALNGLTQGQLWYVFYVDPTFTGGAVTPIATQNRADFENQLGHFLIDSVVTPVYTGAGTGGGRFYPSMFADQGTRTTATPEAAFDGDTTTAAGVSAQGTRSSTADGQGRWSGWPNIGLTGASLYVTLGSFSVHTSGGVLADCEGTVTVSVGGVDTQIAAYTSAAAGSLLTFALPAGTNLSTVAVTGMATVSVSNRDAVSPPSSGVCIASLAIEEMYIQ